VDVVEGRDLGRAEAHPPLTEQQEKGSPTRLDTRLNRMTRSERALALLVSAGASNKEIASSCPRP
jgi:DNA-binding NarL/FixJ family response regulator